jgi:predicted AlkP superfamily phosphohydrolase/phosphomutase
MVEKLVILGLDGGPPQFIEKGIEEGDLPNFSKVACGGVFAKLNSTIPPQTCPAIPSFYTGRNPGKIGLFTFIKPDGTPVSFYDAKTKAFWEELSEYGICSLIFNLPVTYPPRPFKGYLVCGYPTPSKKIQLCYPPELRRYLRGCPIIGSELLSKSSAPEMLSIFELRCFKTFMKVKKLKHPDFSLYFIKTTDQVQHLFWNNRDIVMWYYKFIDRKILKPLMGESQNLIIFSDHGFEEAPKVRFNVNTWLLENGYLKLKGGKKRRQIMMEVYKLAVKIPPNLINSLKKVRYRMGGDTKYKYIPGVDFHNSKAYFDRFGIRILDKKVKKDIKDAMRDLKHNRSLVNKHVFEKEELYEGPFLRDIPDIVMVPNIGYTYSGSLVKETFTEMISRHTGSHHTSNEGIFMAYGTDIVNKNVNGINIVDIAPTILHIYNVPIPMDMDGHVLKEIFKEDSEFAKRSVKYQRLRERDRIKQKIKELKIKI